MYYILYMYYICIIYSYYFKGKFICKNAYLYTQIKIFISIYQLKEFIIFILRISII